MQTAVAALLIVQVLKYVEQSESEVGVVDKLAQVLLTQVVPAVTKVHASGVAELSLIAEQ